MYTITVAFLHTDNLVEEQLIPMVVAKKSMVLCVENGSDHFKFG